MISVMLTGKLPGFCQEVTEEVKLARCKRKAPLCILLCPSYTMCFSLDMACLLATHTVASVQVGLFCFSLVNGAKCFEG